VWEVCAHLRCDLAFCSYPKCRHRGPSDYFSARPSRSTKNIKSFQDFGGDKLIELARWNKKWIVLDHKVSLVLASGFRGSSLLIKSPLYNPRRSSSILKLIHNTLASNTSETTSIENTTAATCVKHLRAERAEFRNDFKEEKTGTRVYLADRPLPRT
jgi:hypothetical protein